jgi:2-polyprenyl-6-methoxyphenol hydroxylase-like FAD-dependent oxidoreductase
VYNLAQPPLVFHFHAFSVSLIPELERILPETAQPIETISVSYGGSKPDEAAVYDGYTGAYGGGGEGFLRANRARLRTWLSTDLPVRWDKRYDHHVVGEDGKVTVHFHDGTTAVGDVLVGADGVNSPVRNCMYRDDPVKLNALPVGMIAGEVHLSPEVSEQEREMGGSMRMIHAEGFRLWVGLKNVRDDGSCDFYWLMPWLDEDARKPEFWVYTASPEEQLQFVRNKCEDLQPGLINFLNFQKPELMFKPLQIRDILPKVCPNGPVTLIGDAAHAQSPCMPILFGIPTPVADLRFSFLVRGEGANLAIIDALQLGELLSTPTDEPFQNLLRKYEEEMVSRAMPSVLGSRHAVNYMASHRRPRNCRSSSFLLSILSF